MMVERDRIAEKLARIESRKAQAETTDAVEGLRRRRELHAAEKAKVLARLQEAKRKDAVREDEEAARTKAEIERRSAERQKEKALVEERLEALAMMSTTIDASKPADKASAAAELTFTLTRWDPHGLIFEPVPTVDGQQTRARTRVAAVLPESEVHTILHPDAVASTVGMLLSGISCEPAGHIHVRGLEHETILSMIREAGRPLTLALEAATPVLSAETGAERAIAGISVTAAQQLGFESETFSLAPNIERGDQRRVDSSPIRALMSQVSCNASHVLYLYGMRADKL